MHLKLFISIGTVAMGLIGGAYHAQATESAQDMMSSPPLELAQSTGSGGSTGGDRQWQLGQRERQWHGKRQHRQQ